MAKDRITVQEAAQRLGVKDDAVRKRIQRGTLEHDKDPDGRVFVYMDATHDASQDVYKDETRYPSEDRLSEEATHHTHQDGTPDTVPTALVSALHDQVEYLRRVVETRDRELEARTEEIRRRDITLSSLTQRTPELLPPPVAKEVPSEPREAPETGAESPAKGDGSSGPQQRRSWLHKFFFGP